MAMQGDAYSIPIVCSDPNFTPSDVELMEFTVGQLTKTYPGDVTYDSTNKRFLFPLTQEETYLMQGTMDGVVRIKYAGTHDVIGSPLSGFNVLPSPVRTVI